MAGSVSITHSTLSGSSWVDTPQLTSYSVTYNSRQINYVAFTNKVLQKILILVAFLYFSTLVAQNVNTQPSRNHSQLSNRLGSFFTMSSLVLFLAHIDKSSSDKCPELPIMQQCQFFSGAQITSCIFV